MIKKNDNQYAPAHQSPQQEVEEQNPTPLSSGQRAEITASHLHESRPSFHKR
jgi:hypothetical protein